MRKRCCIRLAKLSAILPAAAGLLIATNGWASKPAPLTRTNEGLYLAEAEIHGAAGFFIIDTGAAISAVEPGFASRAGFPAGHTMRRLYGLTQIETLPTLNLEVRFDLAAPRLVDIAMLGEALPYPNEADGLLGLNAVLPEEGGVLEIDFPSGVMRLHDPGDAPVPLLADPWIDISSSKNHPDILLAPVSVEGVAGEAMIDTGLPFIVMNRAYARALKRGGLTQGIEITGYSENGEQPDLIRVDNVRLGPIALHSATVYLLDAPVFDALERKEKPVMILGAPAFQSLKLLIDTDNGRFTAAPPDYFGRQSAACTGSRISCSSAITRMTRSDR